MASQFGITKLLDNLINQLTRLLYCAHGHAPQKCGTAIIIFISFYIKFKYYFSVICYTSCQVGAMPTLCV